jgi:transmembrane sensor
MSSCHPKAERIEDEAAVWAARLRGGGVTEADRERLNAWLLQDPEHQWVLSRYRTLASELDQHFGEPVQNAAASSARQRWRAWSVGLCAAAAAIVVSFVVWSQRTIELTTQTAERHLAKLADGSHVELNAKTRLSVSFDRHERIVRLTQGEALFRVAKDSARPFIVETPAGVVRVTGTVFNVRASTQERAEVTVLEGHVRVRPAKADREGDALVAGGHAVVTGARVDVHTLSAESLDDVIAWRRGEVVFNETPLRDVMDRFGAYHQRAITIAPDVGGMPLGGRYSLDDLEGALEAIERMLPVRVERGAAGAVKIVPAAAR